jgi:hypothetical protein
MRSDHYLHPEFGVLSPTPRFRRELRTACFSVLLGIGIGAAAVIALSGNNNADDAGASHRVGSASIAGEQPTEPVLGYNGQQPAGIEKKVHEVDAGKPERSTAEANSENEKTNAATTCAGSNSSCGNIPPRSTKSRAMRMPAANDGLPIGRLPVGRPDASAAMTSAAPSASSQGAHLSAGRSDEAVGDRVRSDRLENKRKISSRQDPSRGGASPISRGHDKPAREVDRAYALDRSLGPKGFWDWSR